MQTNAVRLRQLRPRKKDLNFFTVEDMQRWARNRRKPPYIPVQTATAAFGLILQQANILEIEVRCALGSNCRIKVGWTLGKKRYCTAVHWVNRRDFVRCRFETFRSVKRGGPVLAGTLCRYQEYLRHGGGRKVA